MLTFDKIFTTAEVAWLAWFISVSSEAAVGQDNMAVSPPIELS